MRGLSAARGPIANGAKDFKGVKDYKYVTPSE